MTVPHIATAGFSEFWDSGEPDLDESDFQARRAELYRTFYALDLIPPRITCVFDLKEARAELAKYQGMSAA